MLDPGTRKIWTIFNPRDLLRFQLKRMLFNVKILNRTINSSSFIILVNTKTELIFWWAQNRRNSKSQKPEILLKLNDKDHKSFRNAID